MLKTQQKGMTLIELMIGLLVGAIISAGAISAFNNSLKSSTDNMNLTRLNQDLRTMMDIMVRDIRRAGFVTSDPALNDDDGDTINDFLMNNPFAAVAVEDGNTCFVYMYNRNYDSEDHTTDPLVDDTERLGFKLVGTELKMRNSSSTLPCSAGGSGWQSLTDPAVEISALQFQLTSTSIDLTSMITDTDTDGVPDGDANNNGICDAGEACNTCTINGSPDPACITSRVVTISLTGRLSADNTVTQTITEQVRIRNDEYTAAVP